MTPPPHTLFSSTNFPHNLGHTPPPPPHTMASCQTPPPQSLSKGLVEHYQHRPSAGRTAQPHRL